MDGHQTICAFTKRASSYSNTKLKMKFIVFFACLFAVAFANEDAKVIKNEAEVNVDSFKYALELDNTVKTIQEGILKEQNNWVVSGEWSYVAPNGEKVKVTYTADETGYHPKIHHE